MQICFLRKMYSTPLIIPAFVPKATSRFDGFFIFYVPLYIFSILLYYMCLRLYIMLLNYNNMTVIELYTTHRILYW